MPLKRFCASCDRQLVQTDFYLDVLIQVKRPELTDDQDAAAQAYSDFCVDCVRGGAATIWLLDTLTESLTRRPTGATDA